MVGIPSGNTSIDFEALRFLFPRLPAGGLSSLTRTAIPLGRITKPFSASASRFVTPFCFGTGSGWAKGGGWSLGNGFGEALEGRGREGGTTVRV